MEEVKEENATGDDIIPIDPETGLPMTKTKMKKLAKNKNSSAKPKMSKEEKEKMWGNKGGDATKKEKEGKKKKEGGDTFGDDMENIVLVPKGDKKDCSGEMPAKYNPLAVESSWNDWWELNGFFKPDEEKAKTAKYEDKFAMVIPPPNVTGTLHLGHALTDAIEDTLTRWHRMSGKVVVWYPGTDHAGIATQVVVEKKLYKEEKITRHDLGREKFLERVWEWKNKHGNIITDQMRKLGTSVDWSRENFTMNEQLSTAVTEAFVRMYDNKLIYREQRLVNWCCHLKTALSDIEVDSDDIEKREFRSVPGHNPDKVYEFGVLCQFAYKVEESSDELVVATTRIETMLGDTAIAVHPQDPRYTHLHGKFVIHPFNNRRIPIICDDILVDMSFGTGAVKVTPAHDKRDFETGVRHKLQMISIFTDDGKVNENGGSFEGMMRFDCRYAIEEALKEKGLWRGKSDNKMQLPICSRSKDVIEPILKPQWWVDTKVMAERAINVVKNGELQIVPSFHTETWYYWLENIREWCISRQLWWGHRIPAYRVTLKGIDVKEGDEDVWVVGRNEEEARKRAVEKLNVASDLIILNQDEDVLDTWFSSGLFPFSVCGWPNHTPDLKAFYPGSLLETGHDILFFWVARMVMMGLTLTDELPFKTVYLHAMVRDKYGRKMSKSLGNVIDPLEVINGATLDELNEKIRKGNLPEKEVAKAIEGQKLDFPEGIPRCGADALRFGLLAYTVQGRDINLDIQRVAGYRMFCNKLWQATRFALMNLGKDFVPCSSNMETSILSDPNLTTHDKWILDKLNTATKLTTKAFKDYIFGDACTSIYNFWLYHLCDVYLETIKPVMYGSDEGAKIVARKVLWICLDNGLRMLHPIMPFVTEELWQRLPGREIMHKQETIMLAPFPLEKDVFSFPESEAAMNTVLDLAKAIRTITSSYNINKTVSVFVRTRNPTAELVVSTQNNDICSLGKASGVTLIDVSSLPKNCAVTILDGLTDVLVSLEGLIDPASEIVNQEKKLAMKVIYLENLLSKINVSDYETKVPLNVREKEKSKLEETNNEIEAIKGVIEGFKKLV